MISRTQLEICVRYSAPVTRSRRVLRVLPLQRVGQQILREQWKTLPETDDALERPDTFGNRRLLLRHHRLEEEFRFGLEVEVETTGAPFSEPQPHLARWKMPSRAVVFTQEIQKITREHRDMPPLERAAAFARLSESQLRYTSVTSSSPPASDKIWRIKRGSCADFTHLYLMLCRCSGIPARYVAGFNLTQGQMHAWAEVWVSGHWYAFDPTLGREASRDSVAVCIGRDFYDCQPHTGSFRGVGIAALQLFCRTEIKIR